MFQRVAADTGTGVGWKSAVGARRRNRDICRRDKESAIELLVVGSGAKENRTNKMHNKGSREVPEAQMSTTAWLSQ